MRRQLIIALLACSSTVAGAQTIYRCGSSYSEKPCAEGTTMQALRAPDSDAASAARKETEREMRVAQTMEKARLKEEAKPAAVYIPKEKAEEAPKEHKPDVFVARVPGEKKKPAKKKKA